MPGLFEIINNDQRTDELIPGYAKTISSGEALKIKKQARSVTRKKVRNHLLNIIGNRRKHASAALSYLKELENRNPAHAGFAGTIALRIRGADVAGRGGIGGAGGATEMGELGGSPGAGSRTRVGGSGRSGISNGVGRGGPPGLGDGGGAGLETSESGSGRSDTNSLGLSAAGDALNVVSSDNTQTNQDQAEQKNHRPQLAWFSGRTQDF